MKNIPELSRAICNSILTHTPIINLPKPPSAKAVGCGIYLRTDSARYLISAGHLLNVEDWKKFVAPVGGDKVIWLNGVLATTYDKNLDNFDIDFSVLRFSARMNKHFTDDQWKFISQEQILVNHSIDYNGYYFVAGYPISGVKKKVGEAVFDPIPFKLTTQSIPQKRYATLGYDEEQFILVHYRRKLQAFGSKHAQITKEIQGISGSGLWYVPDFDDKDERGIPKYYLVGIMTENHKDKGFLLALKIDFVTEIIIQAFADKSFEHSRFNLVSNLPDIQIVQEL
ncbi:hypothetical protein [Sphingobacterium sp. DR205]|uniref:hypothetical protein n=1 Tax=Sphingobacterium sp. DR205 TaxID=2713573 RepID=UPI0013E4EB2A|nr:hypothetical protein [Sphingobacterium sp. DR205]QIH34544.1 hypothetical protein G6053_17315 [Sphingobacterium sp. DR205]